MKKRTILIVALIAFFAVTNLKLQAQSKELQELREIAIIDQKVRIPMRDGVRLIADVYRPKTDKKVPIIFSRTPYNFNNWFQLLMRIFFNSYLFYHNNML
jgi:predicted acyl esterase